MFSDWWLDVLGDLAEGKGRMGHSERLSRGKVLVGAVLVARWGGGGGFMYIMSSVAKNSNIQAM